MNGWLFKMDSLFDPQPMRSGGMKKIINLQVQFEMTRPELARRFVIQYGNMAQSHYKLTLPVDAIVSANPEDPWGNLQDQILAVVTEQITAMDKCIQRYTKGKTVPKPQAYHFELPQKTTLTTVVYPAGISEESLEPQRKELHTEFGLINMPFLRRPMAFRFPSDELATNYLINVHQYIPPPDPEEFKLYLLHGSYAFYHCMQNHENDSDWGALYHCLQVVISWFNYQGYIDRPVPTIAEIQQILKNQQFDKAMAVGEWLNVEHMKAALRNFRISNTITDIRSKAEEPRDLVSHFRHHATPILIWNKVIFSKPKAYILLGMAENQKTDTRKVLTLSTMYTGADDPAKIIEEAAVSWKGKEFWDEMELFSLMMPQRPSGV
ncbi:ufm1-specific protease 2-like [Mustelus asterias]